MPQELQRVNLEGFWPLARMLLAFREEYVLVTQLFVKQLKNLIIQLIVCSLVLREPIEMRKVICALQTPLI